MNPEESKSQVWGGRLTTPPDQLNIQFCAGRDVRSIPPADEELLEFDLWTNLAHAKMLHKSDIITASELEAIKAAIIRLGLEFQKGEFQLDPEKEDVHINIEHYITHTCSVPAGKKIHTGRSRNDQVATDMRLLMRDRILTMVESIELLVESILISAAKETETILPGFTHYQPAMITTMAHWMTAWSQSLLRDANRMLQDLKILNCSPLGAAASFGTSWAIDREFSSDLLGFDGVEENSLDCISSRGENEARIASTVSLFLNHLATISQDLILLSTPYYGMLSIDDRYVTGSSIMPQKRNPDFAEVIRSKASLCHGILTSLLGIQKGSMSGYNRDSQQTKYLILDLFKEVREAPIVLKGVIETLTFNRQEMAEKCKIDFMNSADVADWVARRFNLSFRECYELLSIAVKYSEKEKQLSYEALKKSIKELHLEIEINREEVNFLNDPHSMLRDKTHTGAPSKDAVERMIGSQKQTLARIKKGRILIRRQIEGAKKRCFSK